MTFEQWLNRIVDKKVARLNKPRKRMPTVTKKRAAMNREYAKLRPKFLKAHPFCQITIRYHNLDEQEVIRNNGYAVVLLNGGIKSTILIPRSNQIHHSRKPKCKYLNDTSTWFAASPIGHEWLEANKREARRLGLLFNI